MRLFLLRTITLITLSTLSVADVIPSGALSDFPVGDFPDEEIHNQMSVDEELEEIKLEIKKQRRNGKDSLEMHKDENKYKSDEEVKKKIIEKQRKKMRDRGVFQNSSIEK